MITIDNYFEVVERIGKEKLPDTLLKGHDLVEKVTDNGTSWTTYQGNEKIKKVIDLYLIKLNEFLRSENQLPASSQPMDKAGAKINADKSKTSKNISVYKRAYQLLDAFLPDLENNIRDQRPSGGVTVPGKGEERDIQYTHVLSKLDFKCYITDGTVDFPRLQFDIIINPANREAKAVNSWIDNDDSFAKRYGVNPKEIDNDDIKNVTRAFIKWLEPLVANGYQLTWSNVSYMPEHFEDNDEDEDISESKRASSSRIKGTKTKVRKGVSEQKKRVGKYKSVEHIREEVKFIKRYVGLHNKTKSPNAILSFIKSLQRSIVQKLIRKTSPYADEIKMIQDKLIQAYQKMKGEESFAINSNDLNHLVAIAGGEKVYASIVVIKRFIGLQGQYDEKKIHSFMKYIENLVEKKKITKDDPYADKVNAIYKSIKQRTSAKISISKAELNGLEGIVKACGCNYEVGKIYDTGGRTLKSYKSKTHSDASRGICSHNKGLNGVLTAEEMANRKLDLLPFASFWLSLFGKPAKNFTLMLHGEPNNGKTLFLLKFAQFLAENFGEVLYISSEEFASPTMTKKVNEFVNPLPERLHFAENLKDPNLSNYQFVILDSINDLGLKINEYKEIRKAHPNTAFIFILQHTKAGDFRGGKDWEHLAEIAGEVSKGVVTITKNRYAPKAILDFFKQLGITWQEPRENPEVKSFPIRSQMVSESNEQY